MLKLWDSVVLQGVIFFCNADALFFSVNTFIMLEIIQMLTVLMVWVWLCVGTEKIVLKIREAGLSVVAQMDTQLTKDTAEELYDMCKTKEYYNDLVQFMIRSVIDLNAGLSVVYIFKNFVNYA